MQLGRYNLLINTATINYHEEAVAEIAKIVDTETDKTVMKIAYDRDMFFHCRYHTCVDIYEIDGEELPIAKIDEVHRPCLYQHPEIFLAIMLHELGHYRNGDLTRHNLEYASCKSEEEYHHLQKQYDEEIRKERQDCITKGVVQQEELLADRFSVEAIGKNIVLRSLDYMIGTRKKRPYDPGRESAIREFELRKKAIQRYR